ncbi:MAG TPA: FRG domain-containing protein [Thermoanaerobaculia bacterium]
MKTLATDNFMLFLDDEADIVASDRPGLPVAAKKGHVVSSYREVLKKVAALHFHNPRFKLLFRGQGKDYKLNIRGEKGVHSCLYPTIFRPHSSKPRKDLLDARFQILLSAEKLLKERVSERAIWDHQLVRWAILQHYGVCDTPLLDVTQSLQIALSFACGNGEDEGFLYVLAFPQLTGPISVALESLTQVIDLSPVCPPQALRPHFQTGVLVGDYPTVTHREVSHDGKGMIGNSFACRLLTKFRLTNCRSWVQEGFSATPYNILFPDQDDEWFPVMQKIKGDIVA